MVKFQTLAATAAGALIALGSVNAASAAARTFVSGKGTNSGDCALTAPCRSFAYAITQTNDGGEIVVLDTAGYGGVNITKSVSIVNAYPCSYAYRAVDSKQVLATSPVMMTFLIPRCLS